MISKLFVVLACVLGCFATQQKFSLKNIDKQNIVQVSCGSQTYGNNYQGVNDYQPASSFGSYYFHDSLETYFVFYLAEGTDVTLSTCGATFDTVMTVFLDNGQIFQNDDSCGLGSTISQHFPAGYHTIMIEGFSSSSGEFTLSVTCHNQVYCDEGWTQYRDHCYRFNHELAASWDDAQSTCESFQAHLPCVVDHDLNSYLYNTYLNSVVHPIAQYDLWIGYCADDGNSDFHWIDGCDSSLVYWYPGEPNRVDGIENCVHMSTLGSDMWNDFPCERELSFICEKDASTEPPPPPEPSCAESSIPLRAVLMALNGVPTEPICDA
jgi:hypothetical protein